MSLFSHVKKATDAAKRPVGPRGPEIELVHVSRFKHFEEGKGGRPIVAHEGSLYVMEMGAAQPRPEGGWTLWAEVPRHETAADGSEGRPIGSAFVPLVPFDAKKHAILPPPPDGPTVDRGRTRWLSLPDDVVARSLAGFAERGIDVRLSPGGTRLLVTWPKGRADNGSLYDLRLGERRFVAHLAGSPVACDAGAHGKPEPATCILEPDVPSCDEHARPGPDEKAKAA